MSGFAEIIQNIVASGAFGRAPQAASAILGAILQYETAKREAAAREAAARIASEAPKYQALMTYLLGQDQLKYRRESDQEMFLEALRKAKLEEEKFKEDTRRWDIKSEREKEKEEYERQWKKEVMEEQKRQLYNEMALRWIQGGGGGRWQPRLIGGDVGLSPLSSRSVWGGRAVGGDKITYPTDISGLISTMWQTIMKQKPEKDPQEAMAEAISTILGGFNRVKSQGGLGQTDSETLSHFPAPYDELPPWDVRQMWLPPDKRRWY